ncbi:MAG: Smr/MutS family protein [Enhygromyxa sp.]
MVDLRAELEALADLCGDAVRVAEGGGQLEGATLSVVGGEAIELQLGERSLLVGFAGWVERFEWSEADEREEACELALDFVAAALFGELRVIERERGGRARRELEVLVEQLWRSYGRLGSLGFVGSLAAGLGRVEPRVRSNLGQVRRPASLRDAGPSGHPRFPWAGALRSGAEPAEIAIDGELDLHNFSPKEVAPLVREYIEVCRQRGIRDLRIVHGKGKGVLRRTVHSLLDKHEAVEGYRLGGHREGSWGATIVRLRE